jgi:hypothetical protein
MLDVAVIEQGGYAAVQANLWSSSFGVSNEGDVDAVTTASYTAVASGGAQFSSYSSVLTPPVVVPDNVPLREEVASLKPVMEETDVLIIGCGPSGLSLASEVGCRVGTRCIAIDARKGVVPDSRFFHLFGPSEE